MTIRERLIIQRIGLTGEQPIAALGKSLGITASSMTSLVDRLAMKGYLSRKNHATDRRTTLLHLTSKGHSVFTRELDFYGALLAETLLPLGERALAHVLQALLVLNADPGNADLPTPEHAA